MSFEQYQGGITKEYSKKLGEQIEMHRSRFVHLFLSRYKELLPSLINYENTETVSIDFLKVEVALRNNYDVVIGENKNGTITVLGYINTKQSSGNPADLFGVKPRQLKDITPTIPKALFPKKGREISQYDNAKGGNFVVLTNKILHYVDDSTILNHYVTELVEIVVSRYSLSMQTKLNTIFLGHPNDETINELITQIYRGNPYIKLGKYFDPDDNIYNFNNEYLSQNFMELKREYQNKISELNNMLGINSLAVEKESGVSDAEASGNRGYTTSNANLYLDGRNHGLKLLNKRFGLELKAVYNDEVASEISRMGEELGEMNDSDNL